MAPHYSEPYRVIRVLNEDKTAVVVQSIWHGRRRRRVHLSDTQRLPRNFPEEGMVAAQFEVIADLKRHTQEKSDKKTRIEDNLADVRIEEQRDARWRSRRSPTRLEKTQVDT